MGPEAVTKKETEKRRGEVSERKGQEIGDWRIARRFALRRRGASLVRETSQKALAKNLRTFSGDCTTRDDLE
jgi:hypothetical protein